MEKEKERRLKDSNGETSRSLSPISSPPFSIGGLNYILHTVSKFDTLAGVAIKYGVEVADIKRLNGLVTDLQMFALKTLQIPLPGRHPPSPILSTPERPSSSEQTAYNRRHSDFFESFQSLKLKSSSERKVSPAMSSLRGYYGLGPPVQNLAASEGFEMSAYRKGRAHYLEDGPFTESSPIYNPPLSTHRKSKSAANGFHSEKGDLTDPHLSRDNDQDRWIEKLLGRHQKSEADFTSRTPVKLLKEDNSNGSAISAITGKGLALRPKSNNKTVSGGVDGESYGQGDSLLNDSVNGVRKSSSTPSLQDSDNGSMSSIWPTSKWNLKPDFQGLSSASIARPIFDGLPKPVGRKNKAALD